ncbi:MAG: ribonuclease P protein component [Candidatus Peregrinibacteria bacterium]
MEFLRLRGRKICSRVGAQGRLFRGKVMTVRWLSGAPRHPAADPAIPALYVGVVASAKLDKSAVKRNRMRRRCREALRIATKDLPGKASIQLLIFPMSASLKCAFPEIASDVRAFLTTLPHAAEE